MKKFYVMWTYIGNYGGPWEREANTAEEAGRSVIRGMSGDVSGDFARKAKLYVFDTPPSAIIDCRKEAAAGAASPDGPA